MYRYYALEIKSSKKKQGGSNHKFFSTDESAFPSQLQSEDVPSSDENAGKTCNEDVCNLVYMLF